MPARYSSSCCADRAQGVGARLRQTWWPLAIFAAVILAIASLRQAAVA